MSFLTAPVAGSFVLAAARRATLGTVAGEVTLLTALEASVTAGLWLSFHATSPAVASIMPCLPTLVALAGGLSLLAVAARLLVAVTADVALLSTVVTLFVGPAGATFASARLFVAGWTVTLVVISLATVEAAAFVFGFAGAGCPFIGAITHQVTHFAAIVAALLILGRLALLPLRTITLQMALLSASVTILRFLEGILLLLARTVT